MFSWSPRLLLLFVIFKYLDPEKVNSLLSRLRENENIMTSSVNPDPLEISTMGNIKLNF